ncbi:MAG TPA: hypothetical protein VJ672_06580 [Gemmatimonadaceae bacterium]|nr:hypothetical protein [Gemmatimonadaceae bacterium]
MRYLTRAVLPMAVALTLPVSIHGQTGTRLSRPPSSTTPLPTGTTTTTGVTAGTLTLAAPGPAPTGLTVRGTPASATLTWQPAANAVSYSVTRWLKTNTTCCRNSVSNLTATSWTDNGGMLEAPNVYVYALSVTYQDGSVGSAQVEWTPPAATNPTSLTATQKGEGTVELSWPAVPNASYYLLWGPGLQDATRAASTTHVVSGVPAGTHTYMVGAYFEPGPVSTPATQFTRTSATIRSSTANYRVTINGFAVNHATSEDPANWDGVSDEIYGVAFVQIFDRNTKSLLTPATFVESRVHGDVSKWSDRVRAGSLTAYGGIGSGNRVPDNTDPANAPTGQPSSATFPLVVFQGPLTLGKEVVVVRPVLWESDGNRSAFDLWSAHFKNTAPSGTFAAIESALGEASIPVILGGLMLNGAASVTDLQFNRDIKPGTDRPVGMQGGLIMKWQDRMVVITKEKIDAVLDSPYATGAKGILAIPLVDKDGGDLPYSADYVMYLRVERIP